MLYDFDIVELSGDLCLCECKSKIDSTRCVFFARDVERLDVEC